MYQKFEKYCICNTYIMSSKNVKEVFRILPCENITLAFFCILKLKRLAIVGMRYNQRCDAININSCSVAFTIVYTLRF